MTDADNVLPPLLREIVKQIAVDIVKKGQQITYGKIMTELQSRNCRLPADIGRSISSWTSNPNNIASIKSEAAPATDGTGTTTAGGITPSGKNKSKLSSDKEKSNVAKRQKTGDAGSSDSSGSSGNRQIDNDIEDAVRSRIADNNSSSSRATASPYLQTTRSALRLSDMAGIDACISKIRELIFNPIYMNVIYKKIGIVPTCTILLHGPSGCGKTSLANAIAGELNLPFYKVSAPELVGSMSGQSEEKIKSLFASCQQIEAPVVQPLNPNLRLPSTPSSGDKKKILPSVLFIDNIDVIAGKQGDSNRGMDKRILATLSQCIDELITNNTADSNSNSSSSSGDSSSGSAVASAASADTDADACMDESPSISRSGDNSAAIVSSSSSNNNSSACDPPRMVILIAATNKADALEAGIRGRFANEIVLPPPDATARGKILEHCCSHVRQKDLCFTTLGQKAIGYVGADLKILVEKAGLFAVRRIIAAVGGESACLSHIYQRYIANIFAIDGSIFTAGSGSGSSSKTVDSGALLTAITAGAESRAGAGATPNCKNSNANCQAMVDALPDLGSVTAITTTATSDADTTNSNNMDTDYNAYTEITATTTIADTANMPEPRDLQLEALLSEHCHVQMSDFLDAMKTIVPTAKREGFAIVPEITFNDIGALGQIRAQLMENIVFPIQQPELYNHFGLGDATAGILLYGPPGCGKTLLAKAVANECAANFISVKGPELLKSLVGESERGVRDVFDRARASVPCVIFFDEIDSLVPKRGGGSGDNNVSDRVVAQFLTELDGVETRKGVYVIGATNRLELIDDAILRAKRFGTMLYVPLPSAGERAEILQALSRTKATAKTAYSADVDFVKLASDPRCVGFSGADLANLLRESALMAIRDYRSQYPGGITTAMIASAAAPTITPRHFELAFLHCKPSVPTEERERYDMVQNLLDIHNKHPLEALRLANEASARKKHAASRALLTGNISTGNNNVNSSALKASPPSDV